MKTVITVLLMLFTASEFLSADEGSTNQQQLDERRHEYLTWVLTEFGQLEPKMRPFDGRAWSLNQARLYLSQNTIKPISSLNRFV